MPGWGAISGVRIHAVNKLLEGHTAATPTPRLATPVVVARHEAEALSSWSRTSDKRSRRTVRDGFQQGLQLPSQNPASVGLNKPIMRKRRLTGGMRASVSRDTDAVQVGARLSIGLVFWS